MTKDYYLELHKNTISKNYKKVDLFEQKLNPNSYELILTCGWDNKTNESKEFNFNKMIKEALTPNYLK